MVNLATAVRARFQTEEEHLQLLQNRLKRLPATSRTLRQATGKLEVLQEKLSALNPAAVLQRGYAAVIQSDGTIVRTTDGLELGEELTVRLSRGVECLQQCEGFLARGKEQMELSIELLAAEPDF